MKSRAAETAKDSNAICEIALNVLGYREDDSWAALALEMDLRGYGETFEDAVKDLADLVVMQISFAHFKGQPELIFRPADPIWFERFAEVRSEKIRRIAEASLVSDSDYEIRAMPIPPAHVIEAAARNFSQSNG